MFYQQHNGFIANVPNLKLWDISQFSSLLSPALHVSYRLQDDQVVLQCTASILKEQIKLCLSCEGFGNRLCFLETTSNAQVVKWLRAWRLAACLLAFPGFCWLPWVCVCLCLCVCISEHPSRSGHLLLHTGAVSVRAGTAGDAVQHLCGRGQAEQNVIIFQTNNTSS